jgi:hypothetical protein
MSDLRQTLREILREGYALRDILEATYREALYLYPNETVAAGHLGVARLTVQNKMREYKITRQSLKEERDKIAAQLPLKNGKSFTSK